MGQDSHEEIRASWVIEIAADMRGRTPEALAKWAGRAAAARGRLALASCRLKELETETEQVRSRGLNAWNEAAFQLMNERLPGDIFMQPAQAEMSMAVELLDLAERALRLLELILARQPAATPNLGVPASKPNLGVPASKPNLGVPASKQEASGPSVVVARFK